MNVADGARTWLAKTASVATLSPAERIALIEEGAGLRASNADLLVLEGTHYEALAGDEDTEDIENL